MLGRLKAWVKTVKRDIAALWIAARDPRCPLAAKLVAGLVVAYALSPIDLIPDFIPVLGYLDDLILLPLGIALAIRLLPRQLLADARVRAETLPRPAPSRLGLACIIGLWTAGIVLGLCWWFRVRVAR